VSEGTTRAVLAAFAGNLAIAITKAIAAYVTGSGALVAETAHSIADSVNQILLYIGIRRSVQPPTEKHPLGHGKERYFWALIVALFLFFGGGLFSMFEAYERFTHPQELGTVWVGFVVLGLSMVFETFSLSVAVREVRHAAAEQRIPARRFLQQLRDAGLGKAHAALTLEVEWLSDYTDGENAKVTRGLGYNGRCSSAGTAAHAGGNEYHVCAD